MQIWGTEFVGSKVYFVVDSVEVGPVREDGTFFLRGFNKEGKLVVQHGRLVAYELVQGDK